jgi:fimbrial chaperone protein
MVTSRNGLCPSVRYSAAPAIGLLIGFALPVSAASLQVAPVTIELPASAKAASLTLRDLGDMPINAQIRVYRWTQKDGEEQLTPTTDLVASPPAALLRAGEDHVVRVVRVTDKPVSGEESYRLLIDELPQRSDSAGGKINFVVRYSIPIFFAQPDSNPQLAWNLSASNGKIVVRVENTGTRHVRISGLKLETPAGASVSFGEGLVGYVLPHSTMSWTTPAQSAERISLGTAIRITAQGNNDQISAMVTLQSSVRSKQTSLEK